MTTNLAVLRRQETRQFCRLAHTRMQFRVLFIVIQTVVVTALGPLPDASQEGLLWQFKSYSSVALFHYHVPSEVTRATWEFAAFQDDPKCSSRKVHIYLQHGAYPVFNGYPTANGTRQGFPSSFLIERTGLMHMTTTSAYQPSGSSVFPGEIQITR